MVKLHLKCSQVNVINGFKSERTPLYMAAENNRTSVVRELLSDPRTEVNRVVNGNNALFKAAPPVASLLGIYKKSLHYFVCLIQFYYGLIRYIIY